MPHSIGSRAERQSKRTRQDLRSGNYAQRKCRPDMNKMGIYCCGCSGLVSARLTDGREIYPRRRDLAALPFWRCDICKNYVGCHHKTRNRTAPLGNIPTPELRRARGVIHELLDPIWKSGRMPRGKLYAIVSKQLGYQYHTAEIQTVDEARRVYRVVRDLAGQPKRNANHIGTFPSIPTP